MKFEKTTLQELAFSTVGEDLGDGWKKVEDKFVGKSRWADCHEMVFTNGDKFYQSNYRTGSTENCDESPYNYEPAEIECTEVAPVEKTIIAYEPVVTDNG